MNETEDHNLSIPAHPIHSLTVMSHLSRECQILSPASGQQRCKDSALQKFLSVETENTWAGPPPVQSLPIKCFTQTEPPRRDTAPRLSFLAISNSYARRENTGISPGARGRTLVRISRRPWALSLLPRTHHGAGEGALAPRRDTTCLGVRNEAGSRGNGQSALLSEE